MEQLEETIYYISVKFETTNKSYTFSTTAEDIYAGSYVVVETQYGLELGEVVSPSRLESGLEANIEVKPIIRKATEDDVKQYQINAKDAVRALKICQDEADRLNLEMNVIRSEYTLDRSKITFIYVADERVDFRELLKVLANEFHCRIELRQIGARDKAKMINGIGPCGRELCCARYMNDFDMISINMAKNQLLALNVQKLSGHCGKLMCCLKYEDETYKELRKDLPKINAQVEYAGEHYRITSINVIAKNCKLENKESAIYITLDDLMEHGVYKVNNVMHNADMQNATKPLSNKEDEISAAKIQELEAVNKPDILDEVREIVKENKERKAKAEKTKKAKSQNHENNVNANHNKNGNNTNKNKHENKEKRHFKKKILDDNQTNDVKTGEDVKRQHKPNHHNNNHHHNKKDNSHE